MRVLDEKILVGTVVGPHQTVFRACATWICWKNYQTVRERTGPNKYEYLDPLGMFYGEEDDYRLGYLRVHASGEELPPTEAPTSFPTTPAPTSPTAPPVFWQLVGE